MKTYQWIKHKIENGRFRELWKECLWVWQYICRYKGSVMIHLLLGMTIVHDFSFFKSMAMAVLILLGMFVIAFVIFVMLSLSQNLLNFVVQIFNEVTMR